jgi:glutaredoxin 3
MTDAEADSPAVIMYATAWCPYCMRARSLFERLGVGYKEIAVDEEPEQRADMVTRSGGHRTVPQIFIGDRHIGGFDELNALEHSGELRTLLSSQ